MLPSKERSTSSAPQPVKSSKEDPCCWLSSTAAAAVSEKWVLPGRFFHFGFLLPKSLRALSLKKKKLHPKESRSEVEMTWQKEWMTRPGSEQLVLGSFQRHCGHATH